jgi:subtilase family serine protease
VSKSAYIEPLESRQLLSAATLTVHSDAVFVRNAATSTSTSIQGFTPAQISQAYNFNQISFGNGSVAADGQGQTIAIVDAFNDPNITSDLKVFDSQFGLSAPPSLKVVNQNGGGSLPTTDAGWAGEIALDVEWAHAMAPGANILLVEANSDSLTNLMAAVNYARGAAGVSVVSMSWGGSEFFSWSNGEFTGQTQFDSYFTTPSGHQGVTFVAAAGDSGVYSGVQWPASSPNVLSVGGTSLFVNADGSYNSESSWSGTSGGFSQVESEPAYQLSVQNTGVRTAPDVAYNADPNTGFAVYDSVAYQGISGWQEVGGTSAGSPQWAAIIAIANQGRALAGQGTLDGVSQTLPALYGLYAQPGSAGYSTYTSFFNDVVDSTRTGRYHWRFGGFGLSNPAAVGYDTATGLGTPQVNQIVTALAGTDSTNPSGTGITTGGTTGTQTTTPQQLPASQLDGVFVNTPGAGIDGQSGVIRLRITNTASTGFSGPLGINLFTSTNSSTDSASLAADTFVNTINLPNFKLAAGKSKVVVLKYDYPSNLATGNYFLIGAINELTFNAAAAITATPASILISAPLVDLAATYAASQALRVNPGHEDSVVITIKNTGNVTASGMLEISLYASGTQTLDTSTATLLTTTNGRAIRIPPGRSIQVRVNFQAPSNLTGGSYFLIASAISSTQPADANAANDVAVIPTR